MRDAGPEGPNISRKTTAPEQSHMSYAAKWSPLITSSLGTTKVRLPPRPWRTYCDRQKYKMDEIRSVAFDAEAPPMKEKVRVIENSTVRFIFQQLNVRHVRFQNNVAVQTGGLLPLTLKSERRIFSLNNYSRFL